MSGSSIQEWWLVIVIRGVSADLSSSASCRFSTPYILAWFASIRMKYMKMLAEISTYDTRLVCSMSERYKINKTLETFSYAFN